MIRCSVPSGYQRVTILFACAPDDSDLEQIAEQVFHFELTRFADP